MPSPIEESDVVQRELNTAEVERLFVGAVDQALDAKDAETFQSLLASDAALKEQSFFGVGCGAS